MLSDDYIADALGFDCTASMDEEKLQEFRAIAKAARREALEEAAKFDLIEFVNGSINRKEAQANIDHARVIGIPMACAAVELYRNKIRALIEKDEEC